MERMTDLQSLPWEAVRPGVASGVFGKALFDAGLKVVLTRVVPEGEFFSHLDPYGHLLHVLDGEGEATVGDDTLPLRPGIVVRIAAGEAHGYRNTGAADLILMTLNIPGFTELTP
ncbi:MAG TPA: cupin domain-containing protein [Geobacteraceae bacterium]